MSQTTTRGRLDNDIAEIMTAQKRNGSITVTVPADAAEELGLSEGDGVLITGSEGDTRLELGPTSELHQ